MAVGLGRVQAYDPKTESIQDKDFSLTSREFSISLLIGTIGCMRFFDNALDQRQSDVISITVIIIGIVFWTRRATKGDTPVAQALLGSLFVSLGSFFKLHPFFLLGVFVRQPIKKSFRTLAMVLAMPSFLFLLSGPKLFFQMPHPARSLSMGRFNLSDTIFQGVFPFFASYFPGASQIFSDPCHRHSGHSFRDV